MSDENEDAKTELSIVRELGFDNTFNVQTGVSEEIVFFIRSMIVARIKVVRLASGSDAGCLRVSVEVTLSPGDELACARGLGYSSGDVDDVIAIHELPKSQRGAGPVGGDIAAVMNNAVVDLIEKGYKKRKKRRSRRPVRSKP